MTAPQLLALASNLQCRGDHHCFYCGSPCEESHPTSVHVKGSFTGRGNVVAPGSPFVCPGCVLCLRESAEITLIDGAERTGQMMRGYSWVIQAHAAAAATKAHLDRLRRLCIDPPAPPFAIVLSDSGQTHQLYRGVVNHAREHVTVTLEAEPIAYRPDDLALRLALCGKLVAATGKPALRDPISSRFAVAVLERYRAGEDLLTRWDSVREQPLTRLATWLSANKELCQGAYPSDIDSDIDSDSEPAPAATGTTGHGGVPAKARRPGRPRPDDGTDRKGGGPRDRQPTLFGPGAPVRGEP